jgi:hypothetical protein
MKTFLRYINEVTETESYGYHVALTKNVASIRNKGVVQFKPSNWIKGSGERYGNGEIFAFENPKDAVRWAAKMDWAKHQDIGTGKVSVVKFRHQNWQGWEEDTADPISHIDSVGKWYKTMGHIKPEDIQDATPITQHIKQLVSNTLINYEKVL